MAKHLRRDAIQAFMKNIVVTTTTIPMRRR